MGTGSQDREALEAIVRSIADEPRFNGVEVLRATVQREHHAYSVNIVVDRENGVDTDLCEAISRYVIRKADAHQPPIGEYNVVVSSAGLDRPLQTPANFRRFRPRPVKVITTLRIANRTEFNGPIGEVTDDAVTILDPHAGPTAIPYGAMKRANLIYDLAEDLKRKR